MGVAQQRRTRAQVVIDKVAADDVGDVAAVSLGDDQVAFVRENEQAQAATSEIATRAVEKIGLRTDEDAWFWHRCQRTPQRTPVMYTVTPGEGPRFGTG